MKCFYHLCNNEPQLFKNGQQKKFCSEPCKNKFCVSKRRHDLKKLSIEYKGGKCNKCGYDRCIDALHFHHLDPSKKEFGLSKRGLTRSWEKIKIELDKCIILCGNCHAETHFELK